MASRKARSRPYVRWFFLLFFPAAAIFAIYGTISIITSQIAEGHTTRGTVISIDDRPTGRGGACIVHYTYAVNDTTYQGSSSPHCVGKVGGAVTVHYDSRHPQNSSVDGLGYSIFVDAAVVILTTLLILATLLIWTYQRHLSRRVDRPHELDGLMHT